MLFSPCDSLFPRATGPLCTVLLTLSITSMAWANPEDIGEPAETPRGTTLTEIGTLSVPHVVIDFDALPAGPTSVGDIVAAYPGSSLGTLSWSTQSGTGLYDFQTNGNALAPNEDGSGDLTVVEPGDAFGNPDTLTIGLTQPTMQFGFDLGDWAGAVNIAAYSGATEVGTLQVDSSGGDIDHFFESTAPFNEVRITLLPDSGNGNWVISGLYVPLGAAMTMQEVSSLTGPGSVLLMLILASLGLMAVRFRGA